MITDRISILIKHSSTGLFVKVDDYLNECSQIPIVLRNRDWSPVMTGFSMKINENVDAVIDLEKGQQVIVQFNAKVYYLGFIKKAKLQDYMWHIEVAHYLSQLEEYRVAKADLSAHLVSESGDWTNPVEFTVDTDNDYIVKTGHGISNGSRIQFRSVGGDLPTGLEQGKVYYVLGVDANNFRVCSSWGRYMLSTIGLSAISYVKISSSGSGTLQYTTVMDTDKYNDWAAYRDIPVTVDSTSERLFTQLGISNYSGDGGTLYPVVLHNQQAGYGSSPIQFSVVAFYATSSLPSNLSASSVYIGASSPNAKNYWKLWANVTDFNNDDSINIADDGSGVHFAIVANLVYKDSSDYQYEEFPVPIVQLKHLLTSICSLVGVTLDTSLVDDIYIYKYPLNSGGYRTIEDIYLFERQLYNINQSTPADPDNVDMLSQINLLELFCDFIGKLGFAIRFSGFIDEGVLSIKYQLVSQARTDIPAEDLEDVIDIGNEDVFVIPDNNILEYADDIINEDSGGYYVAQDTLGITTIYTALCYIFNNNGYKRDYNLNPAKVFTRLPYGTGGQENTIDWYTNLIFLLKDSSTVRFLKNDAFNQWYQANISNFNFLPYSPTINQVNSLLEHYHEEITCRVAFIEQEIWTQKEIYFDVKTRRMRIIQENIVI